MSFVAPSAQVFEFITTISKLKSTPRTGWVKRGVSRPESIADHMYRMAIMAMMAPQGLKADHCALMAIAHDFAESVVGDFTPHCKVTKQEKTELEEKAMSSLMNMLPSDVFARQIHTLWLEFEAGQTEEAKFVRDLDKYEMILQAFEYEQEFPEVELNEFFTSTVGVFVTDCVKAWDADLRERRSTWLKAKK
eukprot:TRINITY_DN45415_c0_g1_i1.p1 TRINITY_DN45415_c0_g1~~TRINITY_DN45415_c0_g1_i1.p1  ORF type:complete len:192 (+),score=35.34 TRINITY_DN45415_c0_g1_i1:2-577(+)